MKKDEIFFGENGLTSTSANHIANLAKELVISNQALVDNICFVRSSVNLIGTNGENILTKGWDNDFLSQLPSILEDIEKATSLIAWLREAIKARESMRNAVRAIDLEDYCKIVGKDMPKEPEMEHTLTEDEYYGNLSIKERNRYYQLETLCSVLGKAIHPKGSIAEARKDLANKVNNPNEIKGNGRDTLIYHYAPSVSQEDVDNLFFELQRKHREAQATLNSIKFGCEKAISESEIAAESKYSKEMKEYRDACKVLNAELVEYRTKESQRIGNLKIIIPDSLKDIYLKVSQLGKLA